MYYDERDFSIPKNCPADVLQALDKYAENAYNDVARESALYGQEIAGFLYSPYFFRRFIPIQFMEGITKWREDGKVFSLVDYLAKAIKIKSAANITIGNPRDPRQITYSTPSHIESDAPFVPTKELFNQLYSNLDYCGGFLQCPKAFRFVWELKSSRLSEDKISSVLADFVYSHEEPVKIGALTLRSVRYGSRQKHFHFNNEVAQKAHQNGVSRTSAKIIDAWFDYVNETSVFSPDRFCRVVNTGGHSAFEFARISSSPYFHLFLNELKTLTILERNGGFVFEERKNFLPLSLLQSIPVNGELTYVNALDSVLYGVGKQTAEDIALSEDYIICFLRAGIYYTIKNRIAFEGMDYHGISDPESAFNTALDDVFNLNSESDLEDFAESEFFDEIVPVRSSDSAAQPVNAFGSGSDFMNTRKPVVPPAMKDGRPVYPFPTTAGCQVPPTSPTPRPAPTSYPDKFSTPSTSRPSGLPTPPTSDSRPQPAPQPASSASTGYGSDLTELWNDLKNDPEFIDLVFGYAKKKKGKFITNSKGEKAYAGDTVKIEWLAPTIFGNSYTGKIAEVHDNRIVFDDNAMQPLEGVRDFSIIR